jgi:hypothetical protein
VEEARHVRPALEGALAVRLKAPTGAIEIGLLADAREDVGELSAFWPRVERLVRGDERRPHLTREPDQALKHPFLLAREVALDLDVAARAAEDRDESQEDAAGTVHVAGGQPRRERAARAPGEAHEPGGARLEIVERRRRGFGSELQPRDQAAEVLVAFTILHEQRQARAVGERDLTADDRPDARVERRAGEARRAVHAVPVHQRHRGHPEARRLRGEGLRLGGALEERERGLRVQLDEHRRQS